jgi:hypothetical protein
MLSNDPASASNFEVLPRQVIVATIALLPEIPVMFILCVMAAAAVAGQGYLLSYRHPVTFRTTQELMLPLQSEICLVVVEIPILPMASVVARLAVGAQLALVHILPLMT